MNKIKVLYDVAKVMRAKDSLSGTINIAAAKDTAEAFRFVNEFSKDMVSGKTIAKISTVVDHDGKQIKHESTTEFKQNSDHGDGHHWCTRHPGFHHHHSGRHGIGLKGKLDRLIHVLGALNDMKIVEQDDKSLLLSLDLTGIPEDMREAFREIMLHKHHGPECLNGTHAIEKASLECKISKNYEVEIITASVQGKLVEDNEQNHDVVLNAAIRFTW